MINGRATLAAVVSRLRKLKRGQFYLSVWLGQLITIAYATFDSFFVGRTMPLSLGALALGNSIYVPAIVSSTAVLSGTTILIARNQRRRCLQALVSKAFLLATCLGAVIVLLLNCLPNTEVWGAADPALRDGASSYLFWLSFGVFPSMFFRVLAAVLHGAGLSKYGAFLQAAGLILKCFVALLLYKVIRRMSVVEICALSTAASFLFLGLSSILLIYRHPELRRYRPTWAPQLLTLGSYKHLLVAGLPIGAASLAELSAFSVVSLEITRGGALDLSAHQIACSVMNLGYSLISAFAIVTSVEVGRLHQSAEGGTRSQKVRDAFFEAIGIGLGLMLICMLFGSVIASMYTSSDDVGALVRQILPLVAIVFVFDSVQSTAASSLRASGYNLIPLCVQLLGLWCGGVLLGHYFATAPISTALLPPNPVVRYWAGIAVGMFFTALSLCGCTMKLRLAGIRRADTRV